MRDLGELSSVVLTGPPRHMVRCGWFWGWAAVGAAGALGLVSLGPISLLAAAIAAGAMARSRNSRHSLSGLAMGAGLLSLFIAFLQRDGPGTTCWHTATSAGCAQHLNPIPWLVAGMLLTIGAVIVQVRRSA